ncbi:FecR family protein [Pararobbsia silviterrae]|nr:FecR domain-containing protein [Pararobbsia silviterrae]
MDRSPLPNDARAEPRADERTDIDARAAAWFVQRRDGLAREDEAAFRAWLAAHPAHRAAYDQVSEVWRVLDAMPADDIARLRSEFAHTDPAVHARSWRSSASNASSASPASPARRAFFPRFAAAGAAFAMTGAGVVAWQYWRANPTFTAVYETRRGEVKTVSLPDGSTMDLDTETHVEARLFHDRREVHLIRGQAMFAVASNPDCPFKVMARAVTVTVVGTRFAVRCTDTGLEHDNVRVDVEEGHVRVASAWREDGSRDDGSPADGSSRVVDLTAGQSVATLASGALGPVAAITPAEVAEWRQGRVSFDNTTLQRALQEFERYAATPIVIGDPAIGAMRVTGSFDIHEATRFARALPRVLPVRLRQRGGVIEIVRAS